MASGGSGVSIGGISRVQAQFKLAQSVIDRELPGALYEEGEEIMGRSVEEFVPVDLGALRASGHVTQPKSMGDETVVELVYGGPAAPYAVIQHERLDFDHNVGQAKYLEIPALEAVPGMAARIGGRIARRLRGIF